MTHSTVMHCNVIHHMFIGSVFTIIVSMYRGDTCLLACCGGYVEVPVTGLHRSHVGVTSGSPQSKLGAILHPISIVVTPRETPWKASRPGMECKVEKHWCCVQ